MVSGYARMWPRAVFYTKALNRSEEHTSELQSLRHLVCRLLLEKKNNENTKVTDSTLFLAAIVAPAFVPRARAGLPDGDIRSRTAVLSQPRRRYIFFFF